MFSILFSAIRSNVSMFDDLVIDKYLLYRISGDNFSFQTKIKTGEDRLLRVSIYLNFFTSTVMSSPVFITYFIPQQLFTYSFMFHDLFDSTTFCCLLIG